MYWFELAALTSQVPLVNASLSALPGNTSYSTKIYSDPFSATTIKMGKGSLVWLCETLPLTIVWTFIFFTVVVGVSNSYYECTRAGHIWLSLC